MEDWDRDGKKWFTFQYTPRTALDTEQNIRDIFKTSHKH
jgi:hypothetical protein